MRNSLIFVLMITISISAVASANARTMSLSDALRLGEKISPDLQASADRESQAQASLGIARSYLYPSLDLSAVDSVGFPGSTSPVPPELAGMITSPFRVGPAGGVLGRISLLDVSHWHGASAALEQTHATQEQTKILRMQVDEAVLQSYLESSRIHGEMEVWHSISDKVDALEKAIHKFVENGQASEVAGLLIEDEGEESRMNYLALEERYRQSLKRLALLTGTDEQEINCPSATSLMEENLRFLKSGSRSPLITESESELHVAQDISSKASAQNLPKIYAAGSAAMMSNTRLEPKQDYAAWIGVTVPIFEGFKISSESQRARSSVDEKESLVAGARLRLDTQNARFDETISVSKLQLKLLQKQHEDAVRAFVLARSRYLAFLEPVINLRESIRNLARIENQMNDVNAELVLSLASKALLNGAVVSP